jgi:hypothetical protein
VLDEFKVPAKNLKPFFVVVPDKSSVPTRAFVNLEAVPRTPEEFRVPPNSFKDFFTSVPEEFRVPPNSLKPFFLRIPELVSAPANDKKEFLTVASVPLEFKVPSRSWVNLEAVARIPELFRIPVNEVEVFLTRIPDKFKAPATAL